MFFLHVFFNRPLYFIALFSMPNCISKLLHQFIFKYRYNGAIRDGSSSIDGQHIQPTIFVVSSVLFNSAGTLTLELFPLTCLMHLQSFLSHKLNEATSQTFMIEMFQVYLFFLSLIFQICLFTLNLFFYF